MAQARHPHMRMNGCPAGKAPKHDPAPEPAPQPEHSQDLAEIRAVAMRLVRRLEAMLPPLDSGADATASAAPAPRDDRLLGKGGIIDGFVQVAWVVIRLVDQERRTLPKAQTPQSPGAHATASQSAGPGAPGGHAAPGGNTSGVDGEPLGQRVAAELDRLAARLGTPGVRDPGDPPPGG